MQGLPKAVVTALCAFMLTGCAATPFDEDDAAFAVKNTPVQLSGEQVLLVDDQLACGDREDLWHLTPLGGGREIGKLTDKGRALQFSDDVRFEPNVGATVQVSGKFSLRVSQVVSMHDEGENTKFLEAKTRVVVDHSCFGHSPVLLGIRHGEFTASANPRFRLRLRDEWAVSELLH